MNLTPWGYRNSMTIKQVCNFVQSLAITTLQNDDYYFRSSAPAPKWRDLFWRESARSPSTNKVFDAKVENHRFYTFWGWKYGLGAVELVAKPF